MRLTQRVGTEGARTALWLVALVAGLVLLYLPFTLGTTAMMLWSWPLGGLLLFVSVRGIGGSGGGRFGESGRISRDDEVGRWLGHLGGRCQLLRYVTVGGRSVEYVVVAPSGIFSMSTKTMRGRLTARNGSLNLNGRPLPNDLLARSAADARALEAHLARAGFSYPVRPLLVFTEAHTDVREAGGVTVLPLRWLESLVRTQPQVMSSLEASLVGGALRREARATITRQAP